MIEFVAMSAQEARKSGKMHDFNYAMWKAMELYDNGLDEWNPIVYDGGPMPPTLNTGIVRCVRYA